MVGGDRGARAASSRPFIDGSPDNNIFNLIFGYNGLQRLFGSGGGAGGGGSNFSGASGTLRLFNDLMGGQASWLLPAALIALVAGLWVTRGAPRTDRARAALLLWGGWLLVTAAVFSYSQGIIHTYYAVALAPPIAALVAIGGWLLWQRRERIRARVLAAVAVAVTGGWSYVLLDRTPSWLPWIRFPRARRHRGRAGRAALRRAEAPVRPSCERHCDRGGRDRRARRSCRLRRANRRHDTRRLDPLGGTGGDGHDRRPRWLRRRAARRRAWTRPVPRAFPAGVRPAGSRARFPRWRVSPCRGGAFAGGGSAGASTSGALVKALEANAGSYRWVAATMGSQSAASYELATGGEPVMAIGGFNNNGGELTLSQFIRYVQAGQIHYFIASGGGGGPGRARPARPPSPPGSSRTSRPRP